MAALVVRLCKYCESGKIQFKCLQCKTNFCKVCKESHGKNGPKNFTHEIHDIRDKDADLHNKIDVERMKNTNSRESRSFMTKCGVVSLFVAKWSVVCVFVALMITTLKPVWPLLTSFYGDALVMIVLYFLACYPFITKTQKITLKNAKATPFETAGLKFD